MNILNNIGKTAIEITNKVEEPNLFFSISGAYITMAVFTIIIIICILFGVRVNICLALIVILVIVSVTQILASLLSYKSPLSVASEISSHYNIEIMNEDNFNKSIWQIEDFESIEMTYKVSEKIYVEKVYAMKKMIDGSKEKYSFELFMSPDRDKTEPIPFEACSPDSCPDGIRVFNPSV